MAIVRELRPKREPTGGDEILVRSGPGLCMRCQHTWHAQVEIKELEARDGWFDCPNCPSKGCARFTTRHGYEGSVWKCPCGNTWFHIIPDGWFCPGCGKSHPINKPHPPA